MASKTPPDGFVFIDDSPNGPGIASRLGITPGTYRKWRMAGKGPETFFLGKHVCARIESVDAYIRDLELQAQQPSQDSRPPEARRPKRSAARRPRKSSTDTPCELALAG
ncbi:hypothetical protein [Streptomyces natalensis]|uniref:Excisionase n=1 Tax=Streptomyces natalensis ATCC 27448 TaxID=1240678 RepID=A0A0D7CM18_9ACTN|nr:hypothetical protein [Streptomyces natalensis]KIZ16905.1 hypothetical protein SNA_18210 [Streptomyces natalensis ATCC 27448]